MGRPERDIIFIGTPNLCSPHHWHRPTVILVAAYAAQVNMERKLFRLTASSQMVPPLGTIWTANKKFGGAVLGSGLEEGGAVFGFGH